MKTDRGQEIEFWTIRERKGRSKPWELRWRVDGTHKSKSFKTKALSQQRERALHDAARQGEPFSVESGEPVSWARSAESVYDAALSYARHAWGATNAGNTRRTIRDNLVRLVMASVDDTQVRKDPAPASMAAVRSALGNVALSFDVDTSAKRREERVVARSASDDTTAACLAWVARVSRPLRDVATSADTALALLDDACVRVDGSASVASDTRRRRRGILSAMLDHAVSRTVLGANPLSGLTTRRARSSDAINPRTTPDYDQAGRLLRAIETSPNPTDKFLHAFFAVAYLAGTRPGETRAIRAHDIIWPEHVSDPDAAPGWGVLVAGGSRTEVDASYTDNGDHGEKRGLKGRPDDTVRMVPLPPEAVAVLRWHVTTYTPAPDGRLFWHHTTHAMFDVLPGKVYRRTWCRARATALTDTERALSVAVRPYDLRHGCASLLIGEGIPTPEIARRLGHSVEVLLTTYTHWFKEQEHAANHQLSDSFNRRGPLTGHGSTQSPENPHDTRSET